MRANTVFGSKLKLERFVMLLWNFTERGKSYQQISNAANLPPQAHYVEDKLSPNSIANFIIILLSHFHFCHIKICFRYRNSNVSSKSPGVWDGTNLTILLTILLLIKMLTNFLYFLLTKWYIIFLPLFQACVQVFLKGKAQSVCDCVSI